MNTIINKNKSFILIFFGVVLLSACNCTSQQKQAQNSLLQNNKNDYNVKTFEFPASTVVHLKTCIHKYGYPPSIPENVYWIRPDTTGLELYEKQNLLHKYHFNQQGRMDTYFYQGSMVSGIYPIAYSFKYDNHHPELVREINDDFYKISYRIEYDHATNIRWIEKLDSTGKKIEIALIKINR